MEKIAVEKFAIQLTFEHPGMSPDVVSVKLGIQPSFVRLAPVESANGQACGEKLFWRTEHVFEGQRFFFEEVEELLTVLEKQESFIGEFNKEGIVTITIQLPGQVNIGDIANPRLLQRMGALGIHFGLEVFPLFS